MNNRCLFGGISHRFEFWHKPGLGLLGLTSNVKTSSWFQWQFLWIMWSEEYSFSLYCDESKNIPVRSVRRRTLFSCICAFEYSRICDWAIDEKEQRQNLLRLLPSEGAVVVKPDLSLGLISATKGPRSTVGRAALLSFGQIHVLWPSIVCFRDSSFVEPIGNLVNPWWFWWFPPQGQIGICHSLKLVSDSFENWFCSQFWTSHLLDDQPSRKQPCKAFSQLCRGQCGRFSHQT